MPATPVLPRSIATPVSRAPAPSLGGRALAWYYLAGTPLFLVADLAFGLSVRAAFLDERPLLRFGYYAVAFACGLVMTWRPAWSGVVGLAESGANIVLMIFAVMLGYFAALDAALAEAPLRAPLGGASGVNLVISALVLIVSYLRREAGSAAAPA